MKNIHSPNLIIFVFTGIALVGLIMYAVQPPTTAEIYGKLITKSQNQLQEAFISGQQVNPSLINNKPLPFVSGPADDSLNKPRQPYHLLNGDLPNQKVDNVLSCMRAGCCYETDFQNRIQLTGNYIQRTNNYKRGAPDSCSAPFHELVNNFYKVEAMKL